VFLPPLRRVQRTPGASRWHGAAGRGRVGHAQRVRINSVQPGSSLDHPGRWLTTIGGATSRVRVFPNVEKPHVGGPRRNARAGEEPRSDSPLRRTSRGSPRGPERFLGRAIEGHGAGPRTLHPGEFPGRALARGAIGVITARRGRPVDAGPAVPTATERTNYSLHGAKGPGARSVHDTGSWVGCIRSGGPPHRGIGRTDGFAGDRRTAPPEENSRFDDTRSSTAPPQRGRRRRRRRLYKTISGYFIGQPVRVPTGGRPKRLGPRS